MTGRRIIRIGDKSIGENQPVFIIAEAGVNHNGSFACAKKLIDAAAAAGADAVKFQTFDADELVTEGAAKAPYQMRNETRKGNPSTSKTRVLPLKKGETQLSMLRRLMLQRRWHASLKKHAEKRSLIFLSTPFSLSDAKFLKGLGVPAIKISSSDANNLPYLRTIAKWKLPLILSTGMSDMAALRESVTALRKAGNRELIIFHCTTNYPTAAAETNLRAIKTLRKEFRVPIGFSDHTEGTTTAVAAVSLGACAIEKHLTLDKTMPGPDHKASLTPKEFKVFVRSVRYIEQALGTGKKTVFPSERENAKVARKSVVTLRAVKKGALFTEKNLGVKRPGTGLPPKFFESIIGTEATRDIPVDTLIGRKDYAKK